LLWRGYTIWFSSLNSRAVLSRLLRPVPEQKLKRAKRMAIHLISREELAKLSLLMKQNTKF
jgi:hypothetical protein